MLRARPFSLASLALCLALGGAGLGAACSKAPVSSEDVSTTTLPPIQICYESDGAPCPLPDGGEDGGDDAMQDADAGAPSSGTDAARD